MITNNQFSESPQVTCTPNKDKIQVRIEVDSITEYTIKSLEKALSKESLIKNKERLAKIFG